MRHGQGHDPGPFARDPGNGPGFLRNSRGLYDERFDERSLLPPFLSFSLSLSLLIPSPCLCLPAIFSSSFCFRFSSFPLPLLLYCRLPSPCERRANERAEFKRIPSVSLGEMFNVNKITRAREPQAGSSIECGNNRHFGAFTDVSLVRGKSD